MISKGDKVIDWNLKQGFTALNFIHVFFFQTIKSFLPGMISEQRGHIVTMNSVLGLIAMKGAGDYCSSKFATKGLLESLKWELLAYPYIHMTTIHPYTVDNQMFSGIKIRYVSLL